MISQGEGETQCWALTLSNLGLCLTLLQENFEVFLPFEDYSNSTLVARLRDQYIKAHEDAQAEPKLRGPPGPSPAREEDLSIRSKLHRQALALQVSAQELEEELALRALKDGKVAAALSKCRWPRSPRPAACQKMASVLSFPSLTSIGPVLLSFSQKWLLVSWEPVWEPLCLKIVVWKENRPCF